MNINSAREALERLLEFSQEYADLSHSDILWDRFDTYKEGITLKPLLADTMDIDQCASHSSQQKDAKLGAPKIHKDEVNVGPNRYNGGAPGPEMILTEAEKRALR